MRGRARRFLRWPTLPPSREQMVVFFRGVLVQIKMRRPQEQTLDQQARDQTGKICAKQNTSLAGGNNVGGEDREKTFRVNGLYLWCARRDSNPHDFTHCHLKAARLPIPPRALGIPAGTIRPAGSTAP